MGRASGITGLVVGLILVAAAASAADRQIRPYVATTFKGGTSFVDLEDAVGKPHVTVGVNTAVIGEVFGVDADFAHSPGFFQAGGANLVIGSSVTTITGNIVVALPRRMAEYSLRPYFVAGGGIMRVRAEDYFRVLEIADTLPAIDYGGGVVGFLTNRVGVSWELRRFQSVGNSPGAKGVSFGPEQLSFWRASMALVVRY